MHWWTISSLVWVFDNSFSTVSRTALYSSTPTPLAPNPERVDATAMEAGTTWDSGISTETVKCSSPESSALPTCRTSIASTGIFLDRKDSRRRFLTTAPNSLEKRSEMKGWMVFIWPAGVLGDLKSTSRDGRSEGTNDQLVLSEGVQEYSGA